MEWREVAIGVILSVLSEILVPKERSPAKGEDQT